MHTLTKSGRRACARDLLNESGGCTAAPGSVSSDLTIPLGYTATMNQDVIATVLTGIGVLFGVWRLVHVESESVRRDLAAQISAVSAQISAVNTRIDNVLLADRKRS